MGQQIISPTSETHESVRVKINENFAEVYNEKLDRHYFTPQTLTPADVIVLDARNGVNATLNVSRDWKFENIINALAGQTGVLFVKNEGSGGWVLTLGTNMIDVLGGVSEVVNVGGNKEYTISWITKDGSSFYIWIGVPEY